MIETDTNNLESESLDIETLELEQGELETIVDGVFKSRPIIFTYADGTQETINILTH